MASSFVRAGDDRNSSAAAAKHIHARAETVDRLPTFRESFLEGRRGIVIFKTFNEGEETLTSGWMHEFADTARPMTAAFAAAPVSQFTVFGATPQRDSAVIGFSAATALSDRTSLFVSYDGEVGGGTDNHSLRAGFRITW